MFVIFEFNDGVVAYATSHYFTSESTADEAVSNWNALNKPGEHIYKVHILADNFAA